MKFINKFKSLLLVFAALLCAFCLINVNKAKAAASNLEAGAEISITGVTGNLNNVNIKVEFTTNVNLDGENNALLVGIVAEDGTLLTDAKFVAAQSNLIYDEDGVAVEFQNAPSAIGTKINVEENYKYALETKDFTVVDGSKNMAKLAIVGQKGANISAEVTFTEVKYSVKFGDAEALKYSYKAVVAAPTNAPEYLFDLEGHQQVTGWKTSDETVFVEGSTLATKDLTFNAITTEKVNHTWQDVAEVPATTTKTGKLAHQVCTCGAMRLNAEATALVTDAELKIEKLDHTHSWEYNVNWENVEMGGKPVITYYCSDPDCDDTYTVPENLVTVSEKENSRTNATCIAKGSVTYVATATYETIQATSEKTYELAMIAHTLNHVAAKANSLETAGNIEYWQCTQCHKYFKDAEATVEATEQEVILPKYTLEEAQVVSVNDLKELSGKQMNTVLLLNNNAYTYTFTKPNKSVSLQFKWDLRALKPDDNRLRFHNFLTGNSNWDDHNAAWFIPDQNALFVMKHNSEENGYAQLGSINYNVGFNTIKFTNQAIMNGDVFTGDYLVTVELNGEVVYTVVNNYTEMNIQPSLFINSSSNFNKLYDIDYVPDTLQEATTINVYDLTDLGYIRNVESGANYSYSATTDNYSRIFKFKLSAVDFNSKSEFLMDFGSENTLRMWMQPGNKSKIYFGWALDGHWTDFYSLDGAAAEALDEYIEYEFEVGRIRVLEGTFAGKDLVYVKVNGEYLIRTNDGAFKESCFHCDPQSEKGYPITSNVINLKLIDYEMYDVNYEELQFEEAVTVSVNDLVLNNEYANNSIDLLAVRDYTYTGAKQYGSVIFKGTFNFKSESFNNGDINGTQIRFYTNDWTNPGMFWFNGGAGTLMFDGNNNLVFGTMMEKDKDVNVEMGRLAVMENGEFANKHYFYVKLDGKVAVECVIANYPAEKYTSNVISFTGRAENASNVIKNVAIEKTVTIKVDEHTETVKVLRSGLVVIPTFDSTIVPTDKRIVGWKLEGTDTSFNAATDRIFDDMTIVAEIEDFKYCVTFNGVEYFFSPNEVIEAPAGPDKAFDDVNHYVFTGWVDAEQNVLAANTKATADAQYTAQYTAIAHEFSDWEVTKEATCTEAGSKQRGCACGCVQTETINPAHKLTYVEAVPATCTEDGTIAYYVCSACQAKFADAEGTEALENVVAPAGHTLQFHEAVAETCDTDGNVAYYACEVCGAKFADAEGTETLENVVVAKHHTLVHVEAIPANCTEEGLAEHWACSVCQKTFADELGTEEINPVLPAAHVLHKVDGHAATCEEDGNVEYYHCSECGKNFDANGNQVTNLTIPATGHTYGKDGKCTTCGAMDPNYKQEETTIGCKKGSIVAAFFTLLIPACVLFIKRRKDYLN